MSSLPLHPDTGLHYGAVIPPDWGPFADVRACYKQVARAFPWLTLISPGQPIDYDDPKLFVLFWSPELEIPRREDRKATVALVYSEALDPDLGKLLPAHRRHFDRVYDACLETRYDAVFGHTPYMTDLLSLHLRPHRTPAH